MIATNTGEILGTVLEIVKVVHHAPESTAPASNDKVATQMLFWTIAMALAIIGQVIVGAIAIWVTIKQAEKTRDMVDRDRNADLQKSQNLLNVAEDIMKNLQPEFSERIRLGSGTANKEHAAGAIALLDELTRDLPASSLEGEELKKAIAYRQVICRCVSEWANGPDDGRAGQIANRLFDAVDKFHTATPTANAASD